MSISSLLLRSAAVRRLPASCCRVPREHLYLGLKQRRQLQENKAARAAFILRGYLSSRKTPKHNAQEEHKYRGASFLQLKSRAGSADRGITPPNTCACQGTEILRAFAAFICELEKALRTHTEKRDCKSTVKISGKGSAVLLRTGNQSNEGPNL